MYKELLDTHCGVGLTGWQSTPVVHSTLKHIVCGVTVRAAVGCPDQITAVLELCLPPISNNYEDLCKFELTCPCITPEEILYPFYKWEAKAQRNWMTVSSLILNQCVSN